MASWIEKTGAPVLSGARCEACGQIFYPAPKTTCMACLSSRLTPAPLSETGVLYVYSTIHVGNARFAAPYTVAYVDLPEGVRVFGQLDIGDEAVPLGAAVRLYPGEVGRNADGAPIMGVRFRPLSAEQ
ncbi:MAG: Zn-ribbon domain-containing OB-fold protein [Hyphomonadaceae bacterium]